MAYLEGDRFLYLETPLGADKLLLNSFAGQEGISQLFDFTLETFAENATSVDFDKLIGQKVSFGIKGADSRLDPRDFHGIVVELSQGERDSNFTEYRLRIAPEIWKLTRKFQSRIFQRLSVPDILKKVLAGYEVSYEIQGTFEPREYCTQYQESDFDFISRLMEEEGIYYFFKFAHGSHKLVLANMPASHPDIGGDSKLIYEAVAGGERDEERISLWKKEQFWGSGKYTLWDHNFELPHRKLDAEETVVDSVQAGRVTHKLKLAGNDSLEVYDYPGGYAKRFDGIDKSGGEKASDLQKISQDNKRTVGIRMQQTETPTLLIQGASNCRQMTAGHKFTVQRHFNGDGQYVFTRVLHNASEADFRSGQTTGEQHYENQFACIPYALPFRPPRLTRRPLISGPQTAVVVGPPGEEIFTDKYGRVKVQFHWDREGQNNADSSCWLRVATPWAGKQWGSIFIPRIGHEVVVSFLEGDPDRPIIAGSVYNADMMPPYDLPANKTQSGIKSRSSKGGGSDNYNEIMFEDLSGSELIRIHAEKDELVEVENDRTVKVHHNESITVEHDRTENVQNDETVTIKGKRKHYVVGEEQLQADGDLHLTASMNQNEKVGMNYSRSVGMNINDKTGANYAMDAGMMIHLKAGMSAVIEAGMGLTIKSAGGSIDINPVGVFIQGNLVFINSGAANLSGCGSSPTAPTSPGQKVLSGIQAGAAAAGGGAASAAAASMAQQVQQQVNASAGMASNMVQSVGNQAFGGISQAAAQALAAAEAGGQMAPGAGAQVLNQINGAVQQAQAMVGGATNQAQQMVNTGINAVRTSVQQSVQQSSTAVAQTSNQAAQNAAQTQQQMQQAAGQAQTAANQAAQAGQPALSQQLQQGQQALAQAQATEQQAQQQLQQVSSQAQQTANEATQAGQQQLNQSTQQLNQTAQQAQQTAKQAATQSQAAAQQLQQASNQAAAQGQPEIAQKATQAAQTAQQAANQAQQTANQAQQAANQASTQAQQMSQQSQQQIQQATQAAQQHVAQAANQGQQHVQQATQQATQAAQQAGQMTPQAANQVQQQVNQSAQQASQTVGNTAQAAYQQTGNTANQAAQNLQKGMKGPGV